MKNICAHTVFCLLWISFNVKVPVESTTVYAVLITIFHTDLDVNIVKLEKISNLKRLRCLNYSLYVPTALIVKLKLIHFNSSNLIIQIVFL